MALFLEIFAVNFLIFFTSIIVANALLSHFFGD